jgi:hypothetical protein
VSRASSGFDFGLPLVLQVDGVRLYPEYPVALDYSKLTQLDAFGRKGPGRYWGWFVTGTHSITKHDFEVLTSHAE